MTALRTIRGQRDASGYDFWYEGEYQGHKLIVSASCMRQDHLEHTVEAAVEHIRQGRSGAWFEDAAFDASLRGSARQ